jgi:uncharacterized protein (DUF924 family)
MNSPDESLKFWFSEAVKPYHFRSTPEFDNLLKEKFLKLWEQAKEHQLDGWMESKEGCLALTIILDQFPLNMFRGQVESFSTEQQSREVATHAIRLGYDELLADDQCGFLYLPFMHSESLLDQDYSVALFEKAGMSENLKWAKHHREIVRRFGRFPHRNKILGRRSSSEELAYLNSDEAFLG